jgi:hypothetical protein
VGKVFLRERGSPTVSHFTGVSYSSTWAGTVGEFWVAALPGGPVVRQQKKSNYIQKFLVQSLWKETSQETRS